ncbi:hypothetical protein O3P69_018451 [Scylla paramamosain]|uniref:Selenoprotein F/M domain-containing protein n=1 Tax=Scylla paramamosain TaxID=85552 RepID=A0AAW0T4W1_SCYPA
MKFYHNVEWQQEDDAEPELLLLNKDGEVVQRFDIRQMKRGEIGQLLRKKGFFKKGKEDMEIPNKYKTGPYVEKDEL